MNIMKYSYGTCKEEWSTYIYIYACMYIYVEQINFFPNLKKKKSRSYESITSHHLVVLRFEFPKNFFDHGNNLTQPLLYIKVLNGHVNFFTLGRSTDKVNHRKICKGY